MVCQIPDQTHFQEEDRPAVISCPRIPIPDLETLSASKFLLQAAHQNVQMGKTKWLTNASTGERVNYSDVEPLSRSVGSALFKRGMAKGDVCLYLTTKEVPKVFVFALGVWRCGGVMHSSDASTEASILTRIQDSGAQWVLCDGSWAPQVREAVAKVEWSVEILTFSDAEGCTNVEDIFADDGFECPNLSEKANLSDPLLVLSNSRAGQRSRGPTTYTNLHFLCIFRRRGMAHPEDISRDEVIMNNGDMDLWDVITSFVNDRGDAASCKKLRGGLHILPAPHPSRNQDFANMPPLLAPAC